MFPPSFLLGPNPLLPPMYSLCLSFGYLQTAAASGQRQCHSNFQPPLLCLIAGALSSFCLIARLKGLAPIMLVSGGYFLAIHVPRDWCLECWNLGAHFLAIHVPRDWHLECWNLGAHFWLSMSPGTGTLNVGIWGIHFLAIHIPRDWHLECWNLGAYYLAIHVSRDWCLEFWDLGDILSITFLVSLLLCWFNLVKLLYRKCIALYGYFWSCDA
ncbi:hypothetical protein BDR05DRAFT_952324 [Suillus weaverae]|nr:hypothetical protein BDR05DRAFT_952324 [Suillus weaverae]